MKALPFLSLSESLELELEELDERRRDLPLSGFPAGLFLPGGKLSSLEEEELLLRRVMAAFEALSSAAKILRRKRI